LVHGAIVARVSKTREEDVASGTVGRSGALLCDMSRALPGTFDAEEGRVL
jgi:hypothetical protein